MTQKMLSLFSLLIFITLTEGCDNQQNKKSPSINMTLNAEKQYQTVEGFGVNINPDQWKNGKLKEAIDVLIDDLGCTLFRFDCTGLADWLDPAQRNEDGKYPEGYLQKIYSGGLFRDAWECFRYLNSKGIEPFFNVSGRIPLSLGFSEKPDRLADFDGYAEMVVTMLKWARDKEKLKFSLLAPFNETDLSYPEGPGIDETGTLTAIHAIIGKLKEYNLGDIKLIVMDDNAVRDRKLGEILADTSLLSFITKIGVHTYGMGDEQSAWWWNSPTDYGRLAAMVRNSPFYECSLWMTEYGDLDLTGLAEYDFSWAITRRLLKTLKEGYAAAMFWDAYDNFHKHDTAWTTFGLLQTDTLNWNYTPKTRYFASKQVYKYVLPGFKRVDLENVKTSDKYDVYQVFHDISRHLQVLAFISPDKRDFTIVGMSKIESDFRLSIRLEGLLPEAYEKPIYYYRTSRNEPCVKVTHLIQNEHAFDAILKERSIFTLTTLK